jgi:hypothetical protein
MQYSSGHKTIDLKVCALRERIIDLSYDITSKGHSDNGYDEHLIERKLHFLFYLKQGYPT